MRHNAIMGVITIASCVGVVSSTLLGPMTRLHHRSEKIYGHNRRIATGVAAGYIGGDREVETIAALGSPKAQLLLAGLAYKADETPDGRTPRLPDLETSFAPPPFRGADPSGRGASVSAATLASPPPLASPAELAAGPYPMVVPRVIALAVTRPIAPPAPPVPPQTTPDPPPVVIPVVEPVEVTSPPPPSITAPPPPPPDSLGGGPAPPIPAAIATVPEPATWMAMLTGFALAGGRLRRRRTGAMSAIKLR